MAWVLELPDEFAQTTTVAIRREGKGFSALGLPIVKCVGGSAYLSMVLSNTNVSHGWVRGLQVWDIKKSVYCVVLFSIIAQLISRSLSDMISNTV